MGHQKRIILTLGGKGGTGKTLHDRQLYYFLVTSGVRTLGVDADIENSEFHGYHLKCEHPVEQIDFLEAGEAKHLFTTISKEEPDAVLIDMPGASGQETRDQIDRFGMFNIAERLGYRITIDTVLNIGYNTIASLSAMLKHCGDRADYVAVKSLWWSQGSLNYSRWDESKTRDEFLKLGGIEIEMPMLDMTSFNEMHENDISFFEKDKLDFGDQILVDSFLDLSRVELEKAAKYLGLPWKGTGDSNSGKSRSKKKSSVVEPAEATEQPETVEVGNSGS